MRSARILALAALLGLTLGCRAPAQSVPDEPPPLATPVSLTVPSQVYLDGLALPVSLEFAPDGRLFFVEVNKGQVRVAEGGRLRDQPFITLEVAQGSEHGMLGLVLHPRFADTRWLYVYYTVPDRKGKPDFNRVVRFTERDGVGTDMVTIVDQIPPDEKGSHNGGRMRFGPDGKLYIGTGQAGDEPKGVPKLDSLEGKMLRLNDDGSWPADNPFPGTPVYAMGLRNPYGFDFHPRTGVMYAVDNGPKGYDEFNLIKPGGNYGWPAVIGAAGDARYIDPLWQSGADRYGMSGLVFYRGDGIPEYRGDAFHCLWNTGGLRRIRLGGEALDRIELMEDLAADCRLDVANGPDGGLYVAGLTKILRLGR